MRSLQTAMRRRGSTATMSILDVQAQLRSSRHPASSPPQAASPAAREASSAARQASSGQATTSRPHEQGPGRCSYTSIPRLAKVSSKKWMCGPVHMPLCSAIPCKHDFACNSFHQGQVGRRTWQPEMQLALLGALMQAWRVVCQTGDGCAGPGAVGSRAHSSQSGQEPAHRELHPHQVPRRWSGAGG